MADVIITKTFEPVFKRLSKRHRSLNKDLAKLIEQLRENPLLGTSLGHNMRKIRLPISSKQRGKSGGARVITYVVTIEVASKVLLLTIYDKADRSSISERDLYDLLKANHLS